MTLEIKNGSFKAADRSLFADLNFSVSQGEMVCVQGSWPLACTSLLRCLLGFEPLTEGFISIDGAVLSPASAATFRRLMAYVPRELALPYATMADAARAPFRLKSNAGKPFSTKALLAEWQQLGLSQSLLEKSPAHLTDSQRLRASLATAALLHKDILLVDAPPTLPDSAAAQLIDAYLHALARRGTAIVAVSTDELFAASCNRIVTINATT